MQKAKLTIFLSFATLFLISFSPVYAARTLSIASNKTSLFGDEEMALTASMSGFTNGETIYIKGAFFQSGSTNYFGYTKSGDTWIKNSMENASQRSVKIGEWDGSMIVKSDFSDSGYKGEGDYSFKVRFYYGSSFTADWSSNVLTLAINEPDPTPTLSPTPTNVPTSVPSPTTNPVPSVTTKPQSSPTNKPSATPVKVSPTITPKLTPTPEDEEEIKGTVLGESISSPSSISSNKNGLYLPLMLFLIGGGLIFIAVAIFLTYRQRDLRKNLLKSPNP